MAESITYRRATLEDLPSICALGQMLNRIHHHARPDIYAAATPDIARDQASWLPSLQDADRATFIAERDGTAVGFITVHVAQPSISLFQPVKFARIGSVAVADAQRDRGIGRALMRLAESWAREQGAADVRLAVWTFNDAAVHLYERLGYEVRALEMGKRIEPAPDGDGDA
ncbi:GNAT family N-acetyltransferase [Burkholderia alba]|uniref:GNAT family N-acetyltransferase n=1 Tax=Burkholderia alba TaxID=2683677 RepID=UPI002B053CB3|nr:GNAT family N-acetyltransferase [Burkholderia alba]